MRKLLLAAPAIAGRCAAARRYGPRDYRLAYSSSTSTWKRGQTYVTNPQHRH